MPGPLDVAMSPLVAAEIFVLITAAVLLLTITWALANRRPVKARARPVGRRATVYRHSRTQLQDDRGISARSAGRPAGPGR
jgi:hypothetical protein